MTSSLTLTEVLVHPLRLGDYAMANRYRGILLHARHIHTIPVSTPIAEEAARFRAKYRLRTPDAIQLATAIQSSASVFLTNDRRLPDIESLDIWLLDRIIGEVP